MKINSSVVVVTGGTSGLGEATVRHCLKMGSKVAILDIDEDAGNKLIRQLGGEVIFLKTNVAVEEDVIRASEQVVNLFKTVHMLVNCAGIGSSKKIIGRNSVHSINLFNSIIQVNLVGTFNTVRLFAEKMLNNTPNSNGERGVIINTSSIAAFEGQIGQAAYSASKGAIVSMTLPMARELGLHGIRVVTIAPGGFDTKMYQNLPCEVREVLEKLPPFPQRLGYPSEFAALVQSVAENPMLNGTTIRLDGGMRMQAK